MPALVPQYAATHDISLRPGSNRWNDQSTNHFPSAAHNESDALCSYIFRMQQHNFHSQQLTMQSAIERLELDFFFAFKAT